MKETPEKCLRVILTKSAIPNRMISVRNMKQYDYILFDLDGTLIASAKGVEVSIHHAMDALGLPCPDLSDYTKYVGPPLEDTFRDLCKVPEDQIMRGMELYRDYYDREGQKTNRVFDGIFEMLKELREKGKKLAICTSKNEPVAEKVADILGLSPYLDAVCGSTLDGARRAKADIIPYAWKRLGCTDQAQAVMVGDTAFDARGAELAGVDFIGVTFGYGTVETMAACGAVGFADTPAELLKMLS